MNAHEINKFIGATLAALVLAMGVSVLSDIIFDEKALLEPAYRVEIADVDERMQEEEETEAPFAVLLASADPAAGEGAARVCSACHGFEPDSANGIGPSLYGIVGKAMAAADGFNYSAAMTAHAAEAPEWTYDELNGFLESPQGWVPGTSMGYAGISDPADRANVIAYLRSVSPDAPPLPEVPVEQEVAATAPEASTDALPETVTDAMAEERSDEQMVLEEDAAIEGEAAGQEPAPAASSDEEAAAPQGGSDTQVAAATPAPADDGTAAEAPAGGDVALDPFTALVAVSDPAAGQAAAAVCLACHSIEEGAAHRLGPNIHGVFGAPVAAADGFNYSDAMKNYAADHSAWDVATLNSYLEAPMEVVPGTAMAYAGVKDEADRAAIIAWLHSISPQAPPIAVADN